MFKPILVIGECPYKSIEKYIKSTKYFKKEYYTLIDITKYAKSIYKDKFNKQLELDLDTKVNYSLDTSFKRTYTEEDFNKQLEIPNTRVILLDQDNNIIKASKLTNLNAFIFDIPENNNFNKCRLLSSSENKTLTLYRTYLDIQKTSRYIENIVCEKYDNIHKLYPRFKAEHRSIKTFTYKNKNIRSEALIEYNNQDCVKYIKTKLELDFNDILDEYNVSRKFYFYKNVFNHKIFPEVVIHHGEIIFNRNILDDYKESKYLNNIVYIKEVYEYIRSLHNKELITIIPCVCKKIKY